MDIDTTSTIRVRSTYIAGFYALIPYILANMYLTLVVNWPGVAANMSKVDLAGMHRIANMNFIFCLYTLGVVLMVIMEKWISALLCHCAIIMGFLMGIGVVYVVIAPLQVLAASYITAGIMVGSVIAIYAMLHFYIQLFKRWKDLTMNAYRESQLPQSEEG